jgi:REP element-mobilizing transposase RayT
MKRDYIDFQDRREPLAYLITIRTYGTWLHGDARGSMDRVKYNGYGEPKIPENARWKESEAANLKSPKFELDIRQRDEVKLAISDFCNHRNYILLALNVRSNHVHLVASSDRKPEFLMNGTKSYATRWLRNTGLIGADTKVWSRHGSTRYLWTEKQVGAAVAYVMYEQGDEKSI